MEFALKFSEKIQENQLQLSHNITELKQLISGIF